VIARTWLAMNRAPALVGTRDDKDKPISALSIEATRASAPQNRRAVLRVLADLAGGTAPSADAVIERLSWQAPRRYLRQGGSDLLTRAVVTEAASLGVTGLDALTTYGRVLVAEQPHEDEDPLGIRTEAGSDALIAALDALLPAPVDNVVVQADLTVIIPGPPEPALAAELAVLADAESRGGATVYRVTPDSVRRGLDAGWTAADVHGLFQRRSRTSLPQTLQYLIDDVARRHGGPAGRQRRVVPAQRGRGADQRGPGRPPAVGVDAAPAGADRAGHAAPGDRLLDLLRDAGYAPVAEDATGATVLTRPKAARGPARAAPRGGRVDDFDPPKLVGPRLAGVVEQIRRGDKLARAARRSPLTRTHVDGTAVNATRPTPRRWRSCVRALTSGKLVWVGFVDAHGGVGSKLVRPVSMGGGFLHAEDDRAQTRHTFALHRITSAAWNRNSGPRSARPARGLAGAPQGADEGEDDAEGEGGTDRFPSGVEQMAVQDQPREQEPQDEDHGDHAGPDLDRGREGRSGSFFVTVCIHSRPPRCVDIVPIERGTRDVRATVGWSKFRVLSVIPPARHHRAHHRGHHEERQDDPERLAGRVAGRRTHDRVREDEPPHAE
jgi:hypothetical protein